MKSKETFRKFAGSNILRRWTFEAVLCYNRGCRCDGCANMNLETECRMKHTVIKLVKELGVPTSLPGACKASYGKYNCTNDKCNNRFNCTKYIEGLD